MAKVRFRKYVHSDKSSNFDLAEKFEDSSLLYVGYEVELVYEYDTETKKCELIGAEGLFLGDEKITEDEITKILETE